MVSLVYSTLASRSLKRWKQGCANLSRLGIYSVSNLTMVFWNCVILMYTYLLSIIAFRYIPNSVVARPVSVVWMNAVQQPWYKLPYRTRLAIGWLCLLAIVFGSAFGFPLQTVSNIPLFLITHSDPFAQGTTYGDRAINVLGLFIFQLGFYITSSNRAEIPW